MNADLETNIPLNQILYGPPGTGKTYRTVEKALEILDPQFLVNSGGVREVQKRRFDELVKVGHIRFVTFHQSLSYEDFVEGIRAVPEDGQLRYIPVDGIFKKLCNDARTKVVVDQPHLLFLGPSKKCCYILALFFQNTNP